MEGILRALDLSHEDSNIIVLTDASCKDCERSHEVVRIARLLNVKIHFFLNGYGCGLDNFPHYTYVQQATEGISVNSIESFRSLSLFISGLRQEVLTPGKRSTHYTAIIDSSSEKCQTFNVSIFTVKFKLIVNKKSKFTKINDPLGYSVKAQHINDDYSGYDTDGQPRNGSWTVCTVDDSPIFTITKRDLLDFAVDYYQDGYYSSAIPTAGTYVHGYFMYNCFL